MRRESATRAWRLTVVVILLGFVPASALAQVDESSFAWDVARAVLIDPTTYAPAVISYEATRGDWKASQVLFAHGWVEMNPRFTISGSANDVPVSYAEGQHRLQRTALKVLAYSALNNTAAGVAERLLMRRYPHRRSLIRALSWGERIAFASVLTYVNSADHFRQASANRRLAREYGYLTP